MAELALGVIGLAGVIGAFKDVVDLFSLFLDSRHLGRDFEVLDTKLDIEKTLLLQWADRVGLLRTNHAPQLDIPDTRATVYRALGSIRTLLRDADSLKSRYGVEAVKLKALKSLGDQSKETSSSRIGSAAISAIQMTHFTHEFDKMDIRMKSIQEGSNILKQKVRWVIRDKGSFEALLSQLTHFVTRLNDLIPATHMKYATATDAITDSGLQASLDLRGLKIVLEASQHTREAVAHSARQAIDGICQAKILQKLWFRTIASREENIGDPHGKTLQWLFDPPNDEVPWSDFSRTKAALSTWAGNKGYELFGFFFWNLGTAEEKSLQGLSRSLLYQILSSKPSLISEVMPTMWKELIEKETDVSLPSPSEARLAFRILSRKSSEVGKFCFLVDGLDEFAGDYRDGIAFINELTASPGVKVLVSSRPIPDCVAAFDGMPKLHLHHLTLDDISAYVQDVIVGHRYMQKPMARHRTEALALVEELAEKSSGVFLWVILACRSLLSGFADYDRIAELKRRIDELPPELEELFKDMLNRVDVRHRRQGARLLRLCYEFRKYGAGPMSAMGLALIDDNQDATAYSLLLPMEERRDLSDVVDFWNSYNVVTCALEPWIATRYASAPLQRGQTMMPWLMGKSTSCNEFLDNEEVWQFDCLQMGQSHSETASELSLYGLFLALQCLSSGNERRALLYLWQGLDWGARADHRDPYARGHIFWKMQAFLDSIFRIIVVSPILNRLAQMDFHSRGTEYYSHATLMLAVGAGAVNYVMGHPTLGTFLKADVLSPLPCGCDAMLSPRGEEVSQIFRPKDMDQPDDAQLARARMLNFLRSASARSQRANYSETLDATNGGASRKKSDDIDIGTSNSDDEDEGELRSTVSVSDSEASIPGSPDNSSQGGHKGLNSQRRRRDSDESQPALPKRGRLLPDCSTKEANAPLSSVEDDEIVNIKAEAQRALLHAAQGLGLIPSRSPDPSFTIADVQEWKTARKRLHKKAKVEENGRISKLLSTIGDRDQVTQDDAKAVFGALAYLVKSLDNERLDLHFTSSPETIRSHHSTPLLQAFEKRRSPNEGGSRTALAAASDVIEGPIANALQGDSEKRKPLSLIILTDGVWESSMTEEKRLSDAIDSLEQLDLPPNQVCLQFIWFGGDEEAKRRHKYLDDDSCKRLPEEKTPDSQPKDFGSPVSSTT
ncbi:hypothetical protein CONLIGDRAFT_669886 [Coniochaeta ligniaria NRRL 30616]|uniref:Uncharacterized protein n=1 Tax=Coniochaeta ligniaria NRRL 30616 TaxID=1408157 RepID=A0A1J7JLJ1_9PEZI|nr:hypothetical protein CONLIGDRAFT_669886 [Coniochaeta ligniaria NRRL 30616]